MHSWPGKPYPLGATFDGSGVNFALFSEAAQRVELCLIDDDRNETRIELTEVDGYVWHALPARYPARPALRLPGARPVRPRERAALQPVQAAARPVRQGDRRHDRRRRVAVLLPVRGSRTQFNDDDSTDHTMLSVVVEPVLRLGSRPPAVARVPRVGDLRDARQGSAR